MLSLPPESGYPIRNNTLRLQISHPGPVHMQSRYLFGILIALLGGACLSTSGILLRNLESAGGWQIVFYRSWALFFTITLLLAVRYRSATFRAFHDIGVRGLSAATLLGLGSILYIFAILNTTVANVVFIIGSAPLVTALVAWILLGERIRRSGIVTMAGAVCGIGLMFVDGLASGGMLGNVLAIVMVLTFAFYLLILRSSRNTDMTPVVALSGLLMAFFSMTMVDNFTVSIHDLVICLALGSFQLGLGFLFLTLASRYIPAAEVALFAMSESVLNPLLVWIGVNEVPSSYTLMGSAVILLSVLTYSLIAIHSGKPT